MSKTFDELMKIGGIPIRCFKIADLMEDLDSDEAVLNIEGIKNGIFRWGVSQPSVYHPEVNVNLTSVRINRSWAGHLDILHGKDQYSHIVLLEDLDDTQRELEGAGVINLERTRAPRPEQNWDYVVRKGKLYDSTFLSGVRIPQGFFKDFFGKAKYFPIKR